MECVLAAAIFEYRFALGLLQYEPGDGKIDAVTIKTRGQNIWNKCILFELKPFCGIAFKIAFLD